MNLDLRNYKEIRTPFVFFDETGAINDKANRFFGLGMIKCLQPYFLDFQIRKIRQQHRFFDEIKWNTLSKIKINLIKEIIDCVFSTPGIYFSSIIINKDLVNFQKEFNNDPYLAYQHFTECLLLKNIDDNEILTILADYITVPSKIKFEVDLKHKINESLKRLAISGVHRIDSRGSNVIQIVDLLLGAVIYDFKLKNKLVSGDKNKINVLKYLLKKINITTFVHEVNTKRFKVLEHKK